MLSYDFVHNFEKLPRLAKDDLAIPEAYFMFIDTLAAYDHTEEKLWLIANPGAADRKLGYVLPEAHEWADAYDRAVGKLDAMSKAIFKKPETSLKTKVNRSAA